MSDRPLEGKVAVVTGAGRGIGQAIAVAYARAGAAVCAAARSRDQLDDTVARIAEGRGCALAVPTDVRDYAAVVTRYPSSTRAAGALYKRARIRQTSGRTREARTMYDEVIKRYPRSDEASLAKDALRTLSNSRP